VLAVPLLDVVLAIGRRMRRGIGISHADKEHIHHRLLDIGHSHRQAVLLMYLWSGLISGCVLAAAFIDGRLRVAAILVAAVALATVLPWLIRDRRPHGSDRASSPSGGRRPRHRRTRTWTPWSRARARSGASGGNGAGSDRTPDRAPADAP
jgi:UDP-GlcNAc:undecaprenyl-phosphate GlcNAc-1-phosphate transferase